MPSSQATTLMTADSLLRAVQQLPPPELHTFAHRFAAWQQALARSEAALIQTTKRALPPAQLRRLRQLAAHSETATLSEKELAEYQRLTRRAEALDVPRAEALAELVQRRGQPARQVMAEIGWPSEADDL